MHALLLCNSYLVAISSLCLPNSSLHRQAASQNKPVRVCQSLEQAHMCAAPAAAKLKQLFSITLWLFSLTNPVRYCSFQRQTDLRTPTHRIKIKLPVYRLTGSSRHVHRSGRGRWLLRAASPLPLPRVCTLTPALWTWQPLTPALGA